MRLRLLENLHIPLWLIKDICWAMLWRPLGLIMIIPTALLAFFFVFRSIKSMKEFFPNVAVASWISANSIWMIDEFYELGIRNYCLIFFFLGAIAITWWLIRYFPEEWRKSKEGKGDLLY